MARTRTSEGWRRFLLIAVAGLVAIYLVSRLDLGQIQSAAVMAIIAIVVVVAYERFVGWG
jgi:tetrahydromethanopterin S-methyltransferase subunit E